MPSVQDHRIVACQSERQVNGDVFFQRRHEINLFFWQYIERGDPLHQLDFQLRIRRSFRDPQPGS